MAYENLDAELLTELQGDGRATLNDLADRLDVSVTTISNHLKEMEEAGVIEGYSPDLNYGAIGYDVTAIIQLQVAIDDIEAVSEALADEPQIPTVFQTTGQYDIQAIGKFHDIDEMESILKDVLTGLDIEDSNTSVVIEATAEGEHFPIETVDV